MKAYEGEAAISTKQNRKMRNERAGTSVSVGIFGQNIEYDDRVPLPDNAQ